MSEENELSTEQRVMRAMKSILTRVARETATRPGARPILSVETVHGIRDCLALISAREMELAGGDELSKKRPQYPSDKPSNGSVTVSVDSLTGSQPDNKKH